MIAARDLEARVGSRLLFSGADFTISNGNKIGLSDATAPARPPSPGQAWA